MNAGNPGRNRIRQRDRGNRCYGMAKDQSRCNNPGAKGVDGKFWCHVHKVQQLSALILQESRE